MKEKKKKKEKGRGRSALEISLGTGDRPGDSEKKGVVAEVNIWWCSLAIRFVAMDFLLLAIMRNQYHHLQNAITLQFALPGLSSNAKSSKPSKCIKRKCVHGYQAKYQINNGSIAPILLICIGNGLIAFFYNKKSKHKI